MLRRALAFPLPLKLLVANALLMAVVGAVAILVARSASTGQEGEVAMGVLVFVSTILLLGTLLNALVIRLALSPLSGLAATADQVKRGELSARAPESPLSDRSTARLIKVFNQMLDSVEAARRRQHELAQGVLREEERERERVAHSLFARTAQTLAGAMVKLRMAGSEGSDPEYRVDVEDVREDIATALDEVRRLARQLRPPELADLGVRAALEAHARLIEERPSPRIEVRGMIPESKLSEDSALALFRITQEAITNAVHHSGGECVTVTFRPAREGLSIEVADDGVGFEVGALLGETRPTFGLLGMRERATYVGGNLDIESSPGGGTRVRVLLPWTGPAQVPNDTGRRETEKATAVGSSGASATFTEME